MTGFGFGYPLRGLGAASYTCTASSVCTGNSTAVATEFRRLQALINQLGAKLGLGGPLTVDGKIGPKTVTKLAQVAGAMPFRSDLATLMSTDSTLTPSGLAAMSSIYVEELEAAVSGEIQMPGETVVTTPTSTPTLPRPTSITQPNQTATTTTPIVSTAAIPPLVLPGGGGLTTAGKVAAGAAAVAALGLVAYLIRRRTRSTTPVAGFFGQPKRFIYIIQGNYGYGHGWEDLHTEEDGKEARARLREYRENERGTPFRVIKRREK